MPPNRDSHSREAKRDRIQAGETVVMSVRLQETRHGSLWIWHRALNKRNGRLAWGPVGAPFNRRNPMHWAVAIFDLWRRGDRRA
jgi:hypothetical protein